MSLSEQIRTFSKNYLEEARSKYRATPNSRILTQEIPGLVVDSTTLGDGYKVYGSVGTGNWVEIPWFAILDKEITSSTTKGYYVVFLFDKELQNLYLCLSVGYTQFEEEYGTKEGRQRIKATSKHYARLLSADKHGFTSGAIELHANNNLGKGYEAGTIISKKRM